MRESVRKVYKKNIQLREENFNDNPNVKPPSGSIYSII